MSAAPDCPSVLRVHAYPKGGTYIATCNGERASSTNCRDVAAMCVAAKAWTKISGRKISDDQIRLQSMPEEGHYYARLFQPSTETKPFVPPLAKQVEAAFGACRSIRFAVKNAARYGGEFSLNDILAADRLAQEALSESAVAPAPKPLPRRRVKKG